MSRALSALFIVVLAHSLAMPVWAKKHPAATTTAPTTKEAPKEKGKVGDVETHKHRAKEFENGKELDQGKTREKVGTLSDQVNALDKKLKDSGKAPPAPPAASEAPARRRRGRTPSTQPATQETKAEKSSKSEKSKSDK